MFEKHLLLNIGSNDLFYVCRLRIIQTIINVLEIFLRLCKRFIVIELNFVTARHSVQIIYEELETKEGIFYQQKRNCL
jgi:hypothetical protein